MSMTDPAVLWPDPLSFLETIGLMRGKSILHLSCSPHITPVLKKFAGDEKVYTGHFADKSYQEMVKHLSQTGDSTISLLPQGTLDFDKHIPQGVDVVLMTEHFCHYPDHVQLASAVYNVLKPLGIFLVVYVLFRPVHVSCHPVNGMTCPSRRRNEMGIR